MAQSGGGASGCAKGVVILVGLLLLSGFIAHSCNQAGREQARVAEENRRASLTPEQREAEDKANREAEARRRAEAEARAEANREAEAKRKAEADAKAKANREPAPTNSPAAQGKKTVDEVVGRMKSEEEQRMKDRQRAACKSSEDYVKGFLKFPHDASFPWLSSPDVRANATADIFYVRGTVKAKNALGVALTYEWSTILRLRGNTWTLLACTVGDDVYESPEIATAAVEESARQVWRDKTAAKAAAQEKRMEEAERRKAELESRRGEVTRTWTDSSGTHSVEAEFVGCTSGAVKLRKADGSIVTLALDKLSEDDQEWVKDRAKGRH